MVFVVPKHGREAAICPAATFPIVISTSGRIGRDNPYKGVILSRCDRNRTGFIPLRYPAAIPMRH